MNSSAFCDLQPLVIRGRNISASRPQANVDFTIGYFVFGLVFNFVCLGAWLHWHKKYERTRVRPTAFVVLAVLASLFQMCYANLLTIASDAYPCFLGPLLLVMMIPFASVSIIGRQILFVFLSQLSLAVNEKLKQQRDVYSNDSGEDSQTTPQVRAQMGHLRQAWFIFKRIFHPTGNIRSDEEFRVLKLLITTRGIIYTALVFSLPIFALICFYLTSQEVYRRCYNCAVSGDISIFIIVFAAAFMIKGVVDWVLLNRKIKVEDVWGLKREVGTSLLAAIVVVLGFTLAMYDQSKIYPYSHTFLLTLGFWLIVAVQSVWQLYLAHVADLDLRKPITRAEAATAGGRGGALVVANGEGEGKLVVFNQALLQRILADPVLCEEYEAHLISVYASESLYFIKDVRAWQEAFHSIANTARVARAKKLYRNYIHEAGDFCINISSPARQGIELEMRREGGDVAFTLFDEALNEVMAMLTADTLARFYKKLLKDTPQDSPTMLTIHDLEKSRAQSNLASIANSRGSNLA